MNVFLERLDETMQRRNVNAHQMGIDLHIGETAIYSWKRRDAMPNAQVLTKICPYLDVTADYLLGLDDNEQLDTPREMLLAAAKDMTTSEITQLIGYAGIIMSHRGDTK